MLIYKVELQGPLVAIVMYAFKRYQTHLKTTHPPTSHPPPETRAQELGNCGQSIRAVLNH